MLFPLSLLPIWQERRGSWGELLLVRAAVPLRNSSPHLRGYAEAEAEAAERNRRFDGRGRVDVSLLHGMRHRANGTRTQVRRSWCPSHGSRMRWPVDSLGLRMS